MRGADVAQRRDAHEARAFGIEGVPAARAERAEPGKRQVQVGHLRVERLVVIGPRVRRPEHGLPQVPVRLSPLLPLQVLQLGVRGAGEGLFRAVVDARDSESEELEGGGGAHLVVLDR